MQGTRRRTILAGATLAATVILGGCGRSGPSTPASAERPVSDALGCGDRRDGGRIVATTPRIAVAPLGAAVTPLVLPGAVARDPCGGLQATPGGFGPDPSCLDVRAVLGDARQRRTSWWCRPADAGVDRDASGHRWGMSDTPPTKPLPDIPDEPMPTPMPADPPTPQPGQPSS